LAAKVPRTSTLERLEVVDKFGEEIGLLFLDD